MPYEMTKILPLFFMPVPIVLMLGLMSIGLAWRKRRTGAAVFAFFAIALLWAASLPPVASALLWSLQSQYPPVPLESVPQSECIIVLGGVVGDSEYPWAGIEMGEGVDRVYEAAKLFNEGKGSIVVVAAGNQPWMRVSKPEANLIQDLLVEWGVPSSAIRLDPSSRNTRENALNASALIRESRCQSNILVTSAWHMPRAKAAFNVVGVAVFPVSVDVKGVQGKYLAALWWMPRADALGVTSLALMERMGIWVYRFREWN
jgi:uncharacterized SAM-binding protein YcdF (DUF218 family)